MDSITQWQVSLLTQKQPGLNNANLQVQAKVLHIATTTPTAGLCFHNMNCGIFPRFYHFLSSQRGHPGALLPEIVPGECFDFLVQGVHYMSGGGEAASTKKPGTHCASLTEAGSCRWQPHHLQSSPTLRCRECRCKARSDWPLRNRGRLDAASPLLTEVLRLPGPSSSNFAFLSLVFKPSFPLGAGWSFPRLTWRELSSPGSPRAVFSGNVRPLSSWTTDSSCGSLA